MEIESKGSSPQLSSPASTAQKSALYFILLIFSNAFPIYF